MVAAGLVAHRGVVPVGVVYPLLDLAERLWCVVAAVRRRFRCGGSLTDS